MTGEDSCSSVGGKVAEFFLSPVIERRTEPKLGKEFFEAFGVPPVEPVEGCDFAAPNGNRLRRERKDEIPV
jgi:hypothetical protein